MSEKAILKSAAVVSALSGLVILLATIYPIASYESQARQKYPQLISPVVEGQTTETLDKLDYTKASNWFVGGETANFSTSKVGFYSLTIPKLGVEKATVALGGEDLSSNLIQYPGTANPGKIGNTVVFGHSILPQFFNPEDYMSIFSTLPILKKGDEIIIDYDGITYKYTVESLIEVLPTDIQVLDQRADDSYLSLITCVPPGHPLKPKRLIVRAKIIPPENLANTQQ